MRHAGKRIVSSLCALALLAAMLPAQAMATGTTEPGASVQQELSETSDGETKTDTDAGNVSGQEGGENQNDLNGSEGRDDQTPNEEEKESTAEGGETDLSEDEKDEKTDGADLSGDDTTEADGSREPADGENDSGSQNGQNGGAEQGNLPPSNDGAETLEEPVGGETENDNGETETTPQAEGDVARIGDTTYATLDEAVDEALKSTEPVVITLLKDCDLNKRIAVGNNQTITITADPDADIVITGHGYSSGISMANNSVLTLENLTFNTNAQININGTGTKTTFRNVVLTMDGQMYQFHSDGYYCGAIMADQPATMVFDGCTVDIKNYPSTGSAIRWDGSTGDTGYNFSIINTKLSSTNCYAGFTGTCDFVIKDSTVKTNGHRGNGSNGSNFIIENSTVEFNNNGTHGLSAGNLSIAQSTVTANNNGANGIHVTGEFSVDDSTVEIKGNKCSVASQWTRPGALYISGNGTIDAESKVTITDNFGSGIYLKGTGATLTMESGVVQRNTAQKNLFGGGLYNEGICELSDAVQIYNNNAPSAGDDIYNCDSATTKIYHVGTDWKLDDCDTAQGCTAEGVINGWYDDAENNRWDAHDGNGDCHAVEFTEFDASTGLATIKGLRALKAAHGITATIQPADITIYMGGTNGYDGVSNENGEIAANNSLPEPGFYITLPADINTALQNSGITPTGEYADLSDYLTIHTVSGDRNWTLTPYGNTHSGANERYIYRIAPQNDGQDPVRLEFTDEAGTNYISDEFDPVQAGNLYQDYEMDIYAGAVNLDNVVVDITIPGQNGASPVTYTCTMKTQPGKLKIRYVTGEQEAVVTEIRTEADALPEDGRAYATTPDDTRYFINGSDVDVTDAAAPSLLFDDVVSDHNTDGAQDYDEQLKESALTQVTGLSNPQYQAKYLDLVDANNGNVWLKSSEPVTVYWPYPAGTDKNTSFSLVHFQGLNREMSNGEISDRIDSAAKDVVQVENTEYGIKFTTSSFSPFVLLWDASQPETPGGGTTDGGDPAPTPAPTPTPVSQPTPQPTAAPAAVSAIPQTGDEMPVALLGVSAAGAAVVFVALLAVRKRRHGQD